MGRRRARSPLPQREGLDAVWVRTPARVGTAPAPWASLRDFLRDRLPDPVDVDAWLLAGRFVTGDGTPLRPDAAYTPATMVWFHKDLPPEPGLDPGNQPDLPDLTVLHRDDRLVVIDKPHFVATIPRGVHVRRSALVRARVQLGLPDLAPVHRLDRLTAGVLIFTTEPRWRASYQELFTRREVAKTYEALAPVLPLREPLVVRDHLVKRRGSLRVATIPNAEPNAETLITLLETREGVARYRLEPTTGRTHQLRVHLSNLGAPILGDPLYPIIRDAHADDPANPLRLVARRLTFTDPLDGTPREFISRAVLGWPQSTSPGV